MDYNIIFLRKFTRELILNSAPAYVHEKIRQEREDELEIRREIEESLETPPEHEFKKPRIPRIILQSPRQISQQIVPMDREAELEEIPEPEESLEETTGEIQEEQEQIEPTYEEEEGLYLGELANIILDPNVIGIECPGPRKLVLVRTLSKTLPSRIMLENEEIDHILISFSRESRIPRISGVFKAIVNNMVITAIDSEFAGPRFIITKIHPRPSEFL